MNPMRDTVEMNTERSQMVCH